jgi:hypothetical protein
MCNAVSPFSFCALMSTPVLVLSHIHAQILALAEAPALEDAHTHTTVTYTGTRRHSLAKTHHVQCKHAPAAIMRCRICMTVSALSAG